MFSIERTAGIEKIEKIRRSRIITLITSVRPNAQAQMGDDQVRVLYDHLLAIRGDEKNLLDRLDLYIMSNGGDGIVPWRIISVLREFAKHIGVLVPYRAYSAATLTALGADEIVMGPFAQLGPIDPTVQNDFNPVDPRTNQRLGVSVEDVKSYVAFIKQTVGIHHEDELIRAVEALIDKVHPLALGNVERFIMQSRMIARKLLHTHMSADADKHKVDEIVENMASKLYFHGHPINRVEARSDLQLKVTSDQTRECDDALWDLYMQYEKLFEMTDIYNPAAELAVLRVAQEQARRADYEAAYQTAIAQGANVLQAGQLAAQQAANRFGNVSVEKQIVAAAIESTPLSSVFEFKQRSEMLPETTPGQALIRQEILSAGWTTEPPPPQPPAVV